MTETPTHESTPHLLLRIFAVLTLIAVVSVIQANYFLDSSTGSLDDLIRLLAREMADIARIIGKESPSI